MNLVRLGHFHTSARYYNDQPNDKCETALVCGTLPDAENAKEVNLRVYDDQATDRRELGVLIAAPSETTQTFHLSGECPWKR